MEFLKEFLSEETYAKVEEELQDKGEQVKLANLKTGDYVSKEKYAALESANEDLKSQLETKSTAYDDLMQKAGDNDALKTEIENLKTATQDQLAATTKQYEAKLKVAAIKSELIKAKAKDVKDIIGQLNVDGITYKDDVLTGLQEQINALKETKPYLFEDERKKGKGGLDHGNDDDSADSNAIRAVLGLPIKE
ncbi:MAG: phage scaffolding protein [Eubacterium sp.]